jgi:GNAT superfamily N-acetyltransferase
VTVTPPGAASGCSWYERPDVAVFGMLAVDPALRRTGLGVRLVRHAEERARVLGAGELALDTAREAHHLVAWYAALGYRHVDVVDWPFTNFDSVVMSKAL